MINFEDITQIKDLDIDALNKLSERLREEIICAVSKNGGHLASNLGVVELTLAIHRVFDLPEDKLIFDVSHQSYVHKLLTGRAEGFERLRHEGGVSGFQLRSESEYDFFGGGHSGTSIAAAIGYAQACKLNGSDRYAIAVVGDGSFTNGMIFEALNNAAGEDLRLIVILNDNDMSISHNVGGISSYFGRLRTSANYYKLKRRVKKGLGRIKIIGKPIAWITKSIKNIFKTLFIKTTLFEHLGLSYMGPVDGHNIKKLEAVLKEARLLERPVIVHVCTKKGKGYAYAEEMPEMYHSVSSFDKEKGIAADLAVHKDNEYSGFSQCFGRSLTRIAEEREDIVAISAAMCEGTGLNYFKDMHPERFFDVGIAEEYAVTFAAGLAASGKKPVVALYSSFLQRTYDQIVHDVSIQRLPVVFAIDRSGFVPGDGVTHQGIFDLGILLTIPYLSIYTPETYEDVTKMLTAAFNSEDAVAIRYCKGNEQSYDRSVFTDLGNMRVAELGEGKRVAIVTYGRMVKNAYDAAMMLGDGYNVKVINLLCVKPLDTEALYSQLADSELTVFVEEQIRGGCVADRIISELTAMGRKSGEYKVIAVDEDYPPHSTVDELHKRYGMNAESIADLIKNYS